MSRCVYCGAPTDLPGDRVCSECVFEPVIDATYQPDEEDQ